MQKEGFVFILTVHVIVSGLVIYSQTVIAIIKAYETKKQNKMKANATDRSWRPNYGFMSLFLLNSTSNVWRKLIKRSFFLFSLNLWLESLTCFRVQPGIVKFFLMGNKKWRVCCCSMWEFWKGQRNKWTKKKLFVLRDRRKCQFTEREGEKGEGEKEKEKKMNGSQL